MPSYKTFETQRLLLRPIAKEDAAFIFKLLNQPKWIRFIGDRNVRTVEAAAVYIQQKMTPQLEALGYSNYIMILKSDGAKTGTCGLYNRPGIKGIDLGFALLPDFEGRGLAFEAATRLITAASTDFGIAQLNGYTTKENIASQKLLRKLGFEQVGTARLPGDTVESLHFQLTP